MATGNQDQTTLAPLFLYIPVARLILLSFASFGLYEAYWMYKNWHYIKDRDGLNIKQLLRGIFGVFFCHSLLRRIYEDKAAHAFQTPSFSPGALATGWVVLIIVSSAISHAPGIEASIFAAFIPAFLCFVPVQNYINSVNEKRNTGDSYYGWSSGHIVCLLFGVIMWTLVIVGLAAE